MLHLSIELLDIFAVCFVKGLVDVVVGLLLFLGQGFEVIETSDNQLGF